MRRVFVDTSAFVALRNADEREHAAARRTLHDLLSERASLFTSNHVFSETYTALLVRLSRNEAIEWGRKFRSGTAIELIRVDEEVEEDAWAILEQHADKSWSHVRDDGAERLVDRLERRSVQLDARGGSGRVDLLRARGADDRRRDVRLAQHPGERELGERDPETVGDRAKSLDAFEHVVAQVAADETAIASELPREPSGGGSPGRYLPVRTPCASGDHTICEIPFAAERGITSASGSRWRSEYSG